MGQLLSQQAIQVPFDERVGLPGVQPPKDRLENLSYALVRSPLMPRLLLAAGLGLLVLPLHARADKPKGKKYAFLTDPVPGRSRCWCRVTASAPGPRC